jgi:hypothetical protein
LNTRTVHILQQAVEQLVALSSTPGPATQSLLTDSICLRHALLTDSRLAPCNTQAGSVQVGQEKQQDIVTDQQNTATADDNEAKEKTA